MVKLIKHSFGSRSKTSSLNNVYNLSISTQDGGKVLGPNNGGIINNNKMVKDKACFFCSTQDLNAANATDG